MIFHIKALATFDWALVALNFELLVLKCTIRINEKNFRED